MNSSMAVANRRLSDTFMRLGYALCLAEKPAGRRR